MVVTAEFVPIPSRRFLTIEAEADVNVTPWLDAASDGAIVRVRYQATAEQQRQVDTAEVRRVLLEAGAAVVRVQPEIVRAERARVAGLDEQVWELDALEQWIRAEGVDGMGDALRARTRGYLEATV